MFLKLESTNKNLSWVLEKNPENIGNFYNISNGRLFAFFHNESYNIYFKDSFEKSTYVSNDADQESYLDIHRYADPRIVIDSINLVLGSAKSNNHSYLSEGLDYDQPNNHSITISSIIASEKVFDLFNRYDLDVKIEYIPLQKELFKVKIVGNNITLSKFLKLTQFFCFVCALVSDITFKIEKGMFEKYLEIISENDVPYFVRYYFKLKAISHPILMSRYKEKLESSKKYKFDFTYGNTHDARIQWIRKNASLEYNFLDVGTGEDYRYMKVFGELCKEKGLKYFAIEKDPKAMEEIKYGIKKRGLEDIVVTFNSIEEFLSSEYKDSTVNVLVTEVLEHNEFEEAAQLLQNVVKTNYKTILLSVPNSEFNQFYNLPTGKRHDDHKWEITSEEFSDFLKVHLKDYSFEIVPIGDKVNDIAVSTGAVLKK